MDSWKYRNDQVRLMLKDQKDHELNTLFLSGPNLSNYLTFSLGSKYTSTWCNWSTHQYTWIVFIVVFVTLFVVFVVVVGFVFIVDDTKNNQIYLIIDAEKKKNLARIKPADESGMKINKARK